MLEATLTSVFIIFPWVIETAGGRLLVS